MQWMHDFIKRNWKLQLGKKLPSISVAYVEQNEMTPAALYSFIKLCNHEATAQEPNYNYCICESSRLNF